MQAGGHFVFCTQQGVKISCSTDEPAASTSPPTVGMTAAYSRALLIVLTRHGGMPADLRTFLQSRQEIYAIAPIGVGQRKLKVMQQLSVDMVLASLPCRLPFI